MCQKVSLLFWVNLGLAPLHCRPDPSILKRAILTNFPLPLLLKTTFLENVSFTSKVFKDWLIDNIWSDGCRIFSGVDVF